MQSSRMTELQCVTAGHYELDNGRTTVVTATTGAVRRDTTGVGSDSRHTNAPTGADSAF